MKKITLIIINIVIVLCLPSCFSVPIITATVDSSDENTLSSDATTIELLVKTCLTEISAEIEVIYNGKSTIEEEDIYVYDILIANNAYIETKNNSYKMVINEEGTIKVIGVEEKVPYGFIELNADVKIDTEIAKVVGKD